MHVYVLTVQIEEYTEDSVDFFAGCSYIGIFTYFLNSRMLTLQPPPICENSTEVDPSQGFHVSEIWSDKQR